MVTGSRLGPWVVVSCLVVGASPGCAGQAPREETPEAAMAAPAPAPGPRQFGVYALSRGAGVPEEARRALSAVAALVEEQRENGIAVAMERTRLGLEGEFRLCIEYEEQDAAAEAWLRIQAIVEGVDLVNLAAESCMQESKAR